METMKAYVRTGTDDQEVRMKEMPIPDIQSNEVLLEVKAFGVGIHDRYFIPQNATFPYVIGSEGAGKILKVGENVEDFKEGDRVIFSTSLQNQGGCWAEYAVARSDVLIKLPPTLSFSQGATVPIAGKTALECMRELNLSSGDTLFIAGASGAIGTLVIQMAVAKNVRVLASASQRNHAYMKSLGASFTVDYHDVDWTAQVREYIEEGVDAALAIQPGTGAESLSVVKDGGVVITVSDYNANIRNERNIELRQMTHEASTYNKLKDLVQTIAHKEIKVVIEREYLFDQALKALQKTETRHAQGKSVVRLD